MNPDGANDERYDVDGAHGTIAEQKDEAYYDDRSDASDDIEKGRLKFPRRLYGRDRELEAMRRAYGQIRAPSATKTVGTSRFLGDGGGKTALDPEKTPAAEQKEEKDVTSHADSYVGSRVIFLSGYSGVGKSALVHEFVKRRCVSDGSPTVHASGKFTEQTSAPFSAISEMMEQLAYCLSEGSQLGLTVRNRIRGSDLIGPGMDGNQILCATFPALAPILISNASDRDGRRFHSYIHASMNAIKECTQALLSVISGVINIPLILFLDDLQWGDAASFDMLNFLLSCKRLNNVMFICAYRSNEVNKEHAFAKLMEDISKSRGGSSEDDETLPTPPTGTVDHMDLFSLSPDAITKFIADSVKREDTKGVEGLAEAVYAKTMGNIFFTRQALEELVRKNVLFYDMMCFEWCWVVSKVELTDSMSDDVVATVKDKIRGLSAGVQHLLTVLAYIPNALDVPLLKVLLNHGEVPYEEDKIEDLLKEASEEGMVIFSTMSKCYVFSHDRIRQASLEFSAEKDQDELLLHVARALQDFAAQGKEMEWCLYVAADLLESLPPGKTNDSELIRLNMRVAKIARKQGSIGRENELLNRGLGRLRSSEMVWREYDLTLELCNAAIKSEYTVGSYNKSKIIIQEVLTNAKSLDDKLQAHFHNLLCEIDVTFDYSIGATEAVKILNLYGFDIPDAISKAYLMKEEAKLKIAMRNRSYSGLTKLPVKGDPIFAVLRHAQKCALFSSKSRLEKVLAWKAIQQSMKRGMDKFLPSIIVNLALLMAKEGKAKASFEMGNVSLALCGKIDDIESRGMVHFVVYGHIFPLLQSFRGFVEPLYQCYKDLKLGGGAVNPMLGSMLAYFETYYAAGLELGPLLESKLLLVEELSQENARPGFLTSFQIYRQFSLNMRMRSDDPTKFKGEAFFEEEALNKMNPKSRKMARRDSSSLRLQSAFVFWNEDAMAELLERLREYPITDHQAARLHNRLCFTGLAAFALGKKNDSFLKLGQECLGHFAHLTKLGSVNAKPVHLFMLAMKHSKGVAFQKAIDACNEANLIHLEAMAKERYAALLHKGGDGALANENITSAYWLYQDWGAHAKAFQLSEQFDFLKQSKRNKANSLTLSNTSRTVSRKDSGNETYSFNSTSGIKKKVLVKHVSGRRFSS